MIENLDFFRKWYRFEDQFTNKLSKIWKQFTQEVNEEAAFQLNIQFRIFQKEYSNLEEVNNTDFRQKVIHSSPPRAPRGLKFCMTKFQLKVYVLLKFGGNLTFFISLHLLTYQLGNSNVPIR